MLYLSLACCRTPPSEKASIQANSAVMTTKQEQIIKQVGLDTLPPGSARTGVQMAWSESVTASFLEAAGVHGAVLVADTPILESPGEASREWIWSTPKSPSARLRLNVYVSSTGPATARNRLIRITTETMRSDVPYVRGPADLGDVSALFSVPPMFDHVVWVFHNVCLSLEQRDDPGIDVLAVARALQTALAHHVVDPIDDAIPRVDRVEPSATEVRVNELLTVRIRMQSSDPPRKFLVDLDDPPTDVRVRDASLNLQLTADHPGAKALTILIADASTLLSTTVQTTMIVKR